MGPGILLTHVQENDSEAGRGPDDQVWIGIAAFTYHVHHSHADPAEEVTCMRITCPGQVAQLV